MHDRRPTSRPPPLSGTASGTHGRGGQGLQRLRPPTGSAVRDHRGSGRVAWRNGARRAPRRPSVERRPTPPIAGPAESSARQRGRARARRPRPSRSSPSRPRKSSSNATRIAVQGHDALRSAGRRAKPNRSRSRCSKARKRKARRCRRSRPKSRAANGGPVNVASALKSGEYTAIATEPSSLGNQPGKSSPDTFDRRYELAQSRAHRADQPLERPHARASRAPRAPTPKWWSTSTKGRKPKARRCRKQRPPEPERAWTSGQAAGRRSATGKHTYRGGRDPGKPARQPGREIQRGHLRRQHEPADGDPQHDRNAIQGHDPVVQRHRERNAGRDDQDLPGRRSERHTLRDRRSPRRRRKMGAGQLHHRRSPKATYTAVGVGAEQRSGTPTGKARRSNSLSSSTPSPVVTLNEVESPSKNTTPAFSGTSNDTPTVTVKIYKGTKAEGTVLETLEATAEKRAPGRRRPRKKGSRMAFTPQSATQPSSPREPRGDEQHRHVRRGHEPTSR